MCSCKLSLSSSSFKKINIHKEWNDVQMLLSSEIFMRLMMSNRQEKQALLCKILIGIFHCTMAGFMFRGILGEFPLDPNGECMQGQNINEPGDIKLFMLHSQHCNMMSTRHLRGI